MLVDKIRLVVHDTNGAPISSVPQLSTHMYNTLELIKHIIV